MKKNLQKEIEKKVERTTVEVQDTFVSQRTRTARMITIRATLTVVVIAFASLAYLAHSFPYFPFDILLTRAIQSYHALWFELLMKFVSFIGFFPQIAIIIGVFSLGMYRTGLRLEAGMSMANGILITGINLLLKDIVNRPRPTIDLVHVVYHLGESSFPSGHVMLYVAYFGYLFFLVYTILKKSVQRTILLSVLAVLILLIGPSRMYLGAHWSSDVIGAYLFSSIWLVILIYVHNVVKQRFFTKPARQEKKS